MEFMSVAFRSLEESAALLERYYDYLEGVKEKMPREAYSFYRWRPFGEQQRAP
jgi:hypothetical protein